MTVMKSYIHSNQIVITFNELSKTESGVQMKDGRILQMEKFYLSDVNKTQAMSYLALLENASVILCSENFSEYEIKKHAEAIFNLKDHISQTWPDYKEMYESWKKIAEKAEDDFYASKQEVYKLQQEVEDLKNQLKKAQKKIVYLKRA